MFSRRGRDVDVGAGEDEGVDEGEGVGVDEVDIPFELVGEVASAGAVAEAGHVEGLATARHGGSARDSVMGRLEEERTDAAIPKSLIGKG